MTVSAHLRSFRAEQLRLDGQPSSCTYGTPGSSDATVHFEAAHVQLLKSESRSPSAEARVLPGSGAVDPEQCPGAARPWLQWAELFRVFSVSDHEGSIES